MTIKKDREAAEAEFDNFVEMMDIDVDPTIMDAEALASFKKAKNRLLKAIEAGHLMINDDGEAVYTPWKSKYKEPITFHERRGADLIAMDSYKKDENMAKTFAVMASICKVPPVTFSNLAGPDLNVCMAIFNFLMD